MASVNRPNLLFYSRTNNCIELLRMMKQYQIDLLIKSGAERIIIAYDKEGETNKEREKYFNKLKSFCERYKNICNMGFIYDTKNLLELKQSPFDRGKDIFKQLYKEVFWL